MKTLSTHNFLSNFKPTKSSISTSKLFESNGWISNGFFAIRKPFEPDFSKGFRLESKEVDIEKVVTKAKLKLSQYEKAEIANHVECQSYDGQIIKVVSKSFEVWCNPRMLSYLFRGVGIMKGVEMMISQETSDPIVFAQSDEVLALLMPIRHEVED